MILTFQWAFQHETRRSGKTQASWYGENCFYTCSSQSWNISQFLQFPPLIPFSVLPFQLSLTTKFPSKVKYGLFGEDRLSLLSNTLWVLVLEISSQNLLFEFPCLFSSLSSYWLFFSTCQPYNMVFGVQQTLLTEAMSKWFLARKLNGLRLLRVAPTRHYIRLFNSHIKFIKHNSGLHTNTHTSTTTFLNTDLPTSNLILENGAIIDTSRHPSHREADTDASHCTGSSTHEGSAGSCSRTLPQGTQLLYCHPQNPSHQHHLPRLSP